MYSYSNHGDEAYQRHYGHDVDAEIAAEQEARDLKQAEALLDDYGDSYIRMQDAFTEMVAFRPWMKSVLSEALRDTANMFADSDRVCNAIWRLRMAGVRGCDIPLSDEWLVRFAQPWQAEQWPYVSVRLQNALASGSDAP